MDAQYRKLNGTPVPHLANYAKSYLRAHPEVSLSVGTDSQNIGGSSVYATVVAFRHPGKGVHYLLTKKREPIISDIITRLFKEAEDSINVAEYLRDQGIYQPITIDVDYNESEEHSYHKLIPMVKGWILGLGYQMNTKQNIQVASIAADHLL